MCRLHESIKMYFKLILRHWEIFCLLSTVDKINISMRTLSLSKTSAKDLWKIVKPSHYTVKMITLNCDSLME